MRTDQFQLHARLEQTHWWFVGRRQILRTLVERLVTPHAGKLVIDVGCGTGGNIAALADAYECYGIDTSRDAIELARRRFPRVQFLRGQAPGDLGTLFQRADLLLLMDVLEHVRDDAGLLGKLVKAATPGTRLLLTVPADAALWSQHDLSFGHYRRYDLQGFCRLWEGLPVTLSMVSYFNARLYPAVRLVRAWSRFRHMPAGDAGTDFRLPSRPINHMLSSLLAGERKTLLDLLSGRTSQGYRAGVSLIAVIQRTEDCLASSHAANDTPRQVGLPVMPLIEPTPTGQPSGIG